jgi:hypothetical protein
LDDPARHVFPLEPETGLLLGEGAGGAQNDGCGSQNGE